MPDPSWPSSPPEANYVRLVGSGAAGTATTLASAAAWQALMAANEMAASVSTLNTAATALNFEGLGGAASATAAGGLNTALHLLAGWAQEKPPIAASAVAAYETAVSTMIPAAVALANRAEQAADVAMNPLVLGALTPVIVALDLQYFGEYWPHNASAGAAYGSTLNALLPALAVPPPLAPPGASPAAPASAAAAVAETAAQAAAGEAIKESGQAAKLAGDSAAAPAQAAGQLASSMAQPLQSTAQPLLGMFQAPIQALQSLTGLPQSMLGQLGGSSGPGLPDDVGMSAPMLADAGLPGGVLAGGSGGVPAGLGGTAAGSGLGVGGGGVPGAGLTNAGFTNAGPTNYVRPNSSFPPEGSGRPASLKAGLLSTAELRGPTTTAGAGAVPVSPAQAGMLGTSKGDTTKDEVPRARIVSTAGRLSTKHS